MATPWVNGASFHFCALKGQYTHLFRPVRAQIAVMPILDRALPCPELYRACSPFEAPSKSPLGRA